MSSNLALWTSIADPDHTLSPKATKPVPGGAGLTAIDPFVLYMMATRLWGPIGLAYDGKSGTLAFGEGYASIPSYPCWGFEEVSSAVENGEHTTTVRFWYPHDGKMRYVLGKGCTPVTGGKGDKDTAKKSLTDASTNAMAKVGFGANVYLGLFNDSQYAEGVKQRQHAALEADSPPVQAVRDSLADLRATLEGKGVTPDEALDRLKAIKGGPYAALGKAGKDSLVGGMKALHEYINERKAAANG